jgi:hypothetical protein
MLIQNEEILKHGGQATGNVMPLVKLDQRTKEVASYFV